MNNQTVEPTQNMGGFGNADVKQIEDLQKALTIAQNYGTTAPNTLTGGSALSVENLDRTLKLVTFSQQHLRLWKDINKMQTTQNVSEYNVQNSYGQEVSPFFNMGSVPVQTDANYERDFAQVKFLGTYAQVNHDLTKIQAAHGPVVARETKNKTIELLGRNEKALFYGDSNLNALEYDGVETWMTTRGGLAKYNATFNNGLEAPGTSEVNTVDVRGALNEDVLETAGLTAINNFGMPQDMYMATDVYSNFSKQFFAKQRLMPGTALNSGNKVQEHIGTLDYKFKPSVFNRPRRSPLTSAVSASAAPTLATLASPADGDSQFTAADVAGGNLSYVISAVYADGETLVSSEINGAVSAGDKVTIDITYTGTPLWFNVFRAPAGTTANHQFIGRIAPVGSGSTHDVDFNAVLPGASNAYLLMHDPDTLYWSQLGSMVKYDLAVTDTSYKWLILMYGTVVMPAVNKHVILKNLTTS